MWAGTALSSDWPSVLDIGGRSVGLGQPIFVIAEAGVNHNGSLRLALELVRAAAAAGADAVKFQTFHADSVASPMAPKAEYQHEGSLSSESQLEMLRRLELSADAHRALCDESRRCGILFLATPFDVESVDLLETLSVPALKVSSGDITYPELLERVGAARRPVILSTGMAYLEEVEQATQVLRAAGCHELALLHCVSSYPASPGEANLQAMATLRQAFGCPVGFSDHIPGEAVTLAAAALGACVIEKHLTLDRQFPGPDHSASLEPDEFAHLVAGLRIVEAARGDGIKRPKPGESDVRVAARRSLVTTRALPIGTVLTRADLVALRPGTGISPYELGRIVGRTLRASVPAGTVLEWEMLE